MNRPAVAVAALCLLAALPARAAPAFPDTVQTGTDIPSKFTLPAGAQDYDRREVMVPMRDGVKLFTVIWVPKGAHDAPMILTRTPYDAAHRMRDLHAAKLVDALPQGDDVFARAGYIRVFQDIRGKYGSEGDYVMTRPPIGPLNPTRTDETTDAWDTVEWLAKNVKESNGRVGMLGSSYEGFTVSMALLGPSPHLMAASPESPMVDGWMGDDWYHYGAFRTPNLDYFTGQMAARGKGVEIPRPYRDDYSNMLAWGSVAGEAAAGGLDQLPFWHRMLAHPAYDAFWQGQALDHLAVEHPSKVPTLWLQGIWDQEDMWGAIHTFLALRKSGHLDNNHLVMGPWRHSQVNYDGSSLGALHWAGDTAEDYRAHVLLPFFNQYLKPGSPKADIPRVLIYNTAEDHWDRFSDWPTRCLDACGGNLGKPAYLLSGFSIGFTAPGAAPGAPDGADSYVSDPAHPVPYRPRPVVASDRPGWQTWLVQDQRFVDGRPDVLTYSTGVLDHPLHLSGQPVADLWVATTGSDADWVVKIIDVYPGQNPSDPDMAGFELPLSLDIFRGRYHASFEHPAPLKPGEPTRTRFSLPAINHVIEPGHRLMIQIQSSLFPLYDRNPQGWVDNILTAKPADFRPATQTILHDSAHASAVWLPIVD